MNRSVRIPLVKMPSIAASATPLNTPTTERLPRTQRLCPKTEIQPTKASAFLTIHQFVEAGELSAAIDAIDGPDALGQVDVVGQRPCELDQQGVEGAEAVAGNGIDQALEVLVPVAVEARLFGFLLRAEGLEGARAVEAAVGAVRGAGDEPVAFGPRAAATSGAAPSPAGARALLPFVSLLEMLQLNAPPRVGHGRALVACNTPTPPVRLSK